MKIVLSLEFAKKLQTFLQIEKHTCRFSELKSKAFTELERASIFQKINAKNGGKLVYLPNKQNLIDYLQNRGINNLADYIKTLENESIQRADLTKASVNSKTHSVKTLDGFMVNTYLSINAKLNGQIINLKPPSIGIGLYVKDYDNLLIDKDITIVGVENAENFFQIQKQEYLFNKIKPLFVLRFANSKAIVSWLKTNTNNYLHFGDFDLAGLAIYIAEFRNKLGAERCSFFIPDNIENLIKNSANRINFLNQVEKYKNYDFQSCPEIYPLYQLIMKYKKTLEQEYLIG